jgi:hypothetical protein
MERGPGVSDTGLMWLLQPCAPYDLDVVSVLLPQLADVQVEVSRVGGSVRRILASARAASAACPGYGGGVTAGHSRYEPPLHT